MSLLDKILETKRDDLARAKTSRPLKDLQRKIKNIQRPLAFRSAIASGEFGIIAEIKRKSPSMSDMNPTNVSEAPSAYKDCPLVKAVSILTDWQYFGMTIEDLERLKAETGKPVLRKDFIFDEYQVFEARAFGADAILLMACVLNKNRLRTLFHLATDLGMEVLFECHSKKEIGKIPEKAKIYGINSRKFKSSHRSARYRLSRLFGKLRLFEVFGARDLSTDIDLFRELVDELPNSVVKVAESGVMPGRIADVRDLGFDCALIGTALLKSSVGIRSTLERFESALAGKPSVDSLPVPAAVRQM